MEGGTFSRLLANKGKKKRKNLGRRQTMPACRTRKSDDFTTTALIKRGATLATLLRSGNSSRVKREPDSGCEAGSAAWPPRGRGRGGGGVVWLISNTVKGLKTSNASVRRSEMQTLSLRPQS